MNNPYKELVLECFKNVEDKNFHALKYNMKFLREVNYLEWSRALRKIEAEFRDQRGAASPDIINPDVQEMLVDSREYKNKEERAADQVLANFMSGNLSAAGSYLEIVFERNPELHEFLVEDICSTLQRVLPIKAMSNSKSKISNCTGEN